MLVKAGFNGGSITDIYFLKRVIVRFLNILEVFQIARIGQRVQVDNHGGRMLLDKTTNNMGSNKSGAAGDEDGFHIL